MTTQPLSTDGNRKALLAQKLAKLIPAYLQNCRQDVTSMLEALDLIDFEAVALMGHNMRGSGSAYGFQAITDIGAALEQAARCNDIDAARKHVDKLSGFLDKVQSVS